MLTEAQLSLPPKKIFMTSIVPFFINNQFLQKVEKITVRMVRDENGKVFCQFHTYLLMDNYLKENLFMDNLALEIPD